MSEKSEVLPPITAVSCDSEIAEAFNTFCAMIKANDALLRISRTIRSRRRKASKTGSEETWWPELNRALVRAYIEVSEFHPSSGYAVTAVQSVLLEARSFLEQPCPRQPALRHRNDLQLVDEYLQPAFAKFCGLLARNEERQARSEIVSELAVYTLREWFRRDNGSELECHLEHLVLGGGERPPLQITRDVSMWCVPGYAIEIDREDAEAWGLCEESALNERDAEEAATVSYSMTSLKDRRLGWHQPSSDIGMILYALTLVRERLEARRAGKPKKEHQEGYFCELCDKLTYGMFNAGAFSKDQTGSARFCEDHAKNRARHKKDSPKKREVDRLSMLIRSEASRDPLYMRRFLGTVEAGESADLIEHTRLCLFCQGKSLVPTCLDPSRKYFSKLMAFHANVRQVAYELAHSYHGYHAAMIDRAVQQGKCVREVAIDFGLTTPIAAGLHSGIALARLLHQRIKGVEIARRLGLRESWVSENKSSLKGCFDFTAGRNPELIWWPFDDITGPHIARFPTSSLGTNWRHSEGEYRHLARSSSNSQKAHRRVASSSSLPTRSSARR